MSKFSSYGYSEIARMLRQARSIYGAYDDTLMRNLIRFFCRELSKNPGFDPNLFLHNAGLEDELSVKPDGDSNG